MTKIEFDENGCIGMKKDDLFQPDQRPDYGCTKVKIASLGALKAYRFVVIFTRYQDKWLYCRIKDSDSYGNAGGHIESGETPLEAAERELFEETGALKYTIKPVFDYSVHTPTEYSNGQVFIAQVHELGELPDYEIAEVKLFDTFPDKMRFPQILPVLYERMQEYWVPESKTGWERSNRIHFHDIVENYDKVRWNYPDKLFEDVLKYTKHSNGLKVKGNKAIEIGAGTGKATAPFLNAGYDVTAVEMSANMSEFLQEKYSQYSNFKVLTSTFEDVSLEDESYDLIYAAAAFHWVDAVIGCQKVFRLLKNGGTIALFRYNAIPSIGDPCYDEVQEVYEKHYYNYYKTSLRPSQKSHNDFCTPEEIYHSFRFYDLKDYGFSEVSMTFYDMTISMTADERIALMDTMSDHRGLPDENRKSLYAEQKEVILRYGNRYLENITYQLYMGKKV